MFSGKNKKSTKKKELFSPKLKVNKIFEKVSASHHKKIIKLFFIICFFFRVGGKFELFNNKRQKNCERYYPNCQITLN